MHMAMRDLAAGVAGSRSAEDEAVLLYQSDRTRVLRVLCPDRAGTAIRKEALGPSAMARTRHEIEILSRLAGVAGVVRPAANVPAEVHAITFEDVGARSLADVIRDSPLDPDGLPRLALELATILAGVHRAGVLHRDLNPTNIVLHGVGLEPMLIDFDLATTFAEVRPGFTHHREIVGRLAYLAPEQTGRTGLPVDLRADLYGLGATLYELATGAPPFGDGDALRLVRDILAPGPQPLAEVAPGVGKSALIEQLRPMVTTRGGWYVAGKFDQYRHGTASGAVVQALAGLGRLLLAEPEDELAGQRERMLRALGPGTGLITAVVPEFAALLGADHRVVEGDPTETEVRLRQAQVDLLRAVASPARPIVIVLDDLQWAGQATFGVIDAVQTDERMRGLLLVGAYRDSEVDA